MTAPRIAVIGDYFTDVYHIGTSSRLSPEAPVPVVRISDTFRIPGGAGNVTANLVALGAEVPGVLLRPGANIPQKNRLYVGDHQLARWDESDTTDEARIDAILSLRVDAIVVSDYGKGSITYAVIEAIGDLRVPTYIDSKRNPRDFDIIRDPTFFPNALEFGQHLPDYALQPSVIYKRGADGLQQLSSGYVLDSYPATARSVSSVCGAGDTVIAAYAYACTLGRPAPLRFAAVAAGLVVERPWTATCTVAEIEHREAQIFGGVTCQ